MSPNEPILTARVCRTNTEQFTEILCLYVPPPARVLDMTYGRGVFWRDVVGEYDVIKNDIDPERGDIHYDFRIISAVVEGKFDAVVFDPPYASRSSNKGGLIGKLYNNAGRGLASVEAMIRFYEEGIREAYKVLCPAGILILKCQDEISGGKQYWNHITLINSGSAAGFIVEDLFVMVRVGKPFMRHKHQMHARKNHSYWLVFRRQLR